MDNLAGDVPKIVMSRAAARLAADFTLQHKDALGILLFDQVSHVLVPAIRTERSNGNMAISSARLAGIVDEMQAGRFGDRP